MSISLQVNIIERVKFKFTHYDDPDQHGSHNTSVGQTGFFSFDKITSLKENSEFVVSW